MKYNALSIGVPLIFNFLILSSVGWGDDNRSIPFDFESLPGMELVDEGLQTQGLQTQGLHDQAAPPALPRKKVLVGTKKLVCAGIKWSDIEKPAASAEQCMSLARELSNFYYKNSRGLFKITPTEGYSVEVPYVGDHKNLAAAEALVKSTYKADYYVVPSIFTNPHASGGIAHVKSSQFMTAAHETGHLLGLGHAGTYSYPAGKPTLNAYGDTRSIMGRVISYYITAPQYYYLGWLPASEVTLYDKTPMNFTLKKITDFNAKGSSTIIVPPSGTDARYAFISYNRCSKSQTANCIYLHLASGGGSQRVAEISDEFYDEYFTGLHIKFLGQSNGHATLSVDYDKKPTP